MKTPSADHFFHGLAIALALLAVGLLGFVPVASNDFWLQARIGEYILAEHRIPATLLFPFGEIRNAAFNAHEWLPSIGVHLLDQALGYENLKYPLGLAALILFALTSWLAWRRCGDLPAALMLGLAAMWVANFRHHLRPELVALLCLLAQLHLTESWIRTRRWRWLVGTAAVVMLWANSHGSFILAFAVTTAFGVGHLIETRRDRLDRSWTAAWRGAAPLAGALALQMAASLLNPKGPGLLAFSWNFSRTTVVSQYIKEWLPTFSQPIVHSAYFWVWAVGAVLSLVVVAREWRRMRVSDLLLLGGFLVLAMLRNRFIVFFGFVAAYALAAVVIEPHLREPARLTRRWALVLACLVSVAIAVSAGNMYRAKFDSVPSNDLAPGMREILARPEIQGRVFNSYELGAELIYRAWPRLQPMIDSRVDSYGDDYFLLSDRLLRDEAALIEYLKREDVRYMLLLWRDFNGGVRDMATLSSSSWFIRHTDERAVLLERQQPR